MSGNNGTVSAVIPTTSPYGYIPSRALAVIFILLFIASTVVHGGQAIKYRMWWLFPTAFFCGVIELLGWFGRLWSSYSPFVGTPFQIQITCTIIAPTPLLAANFVILGDIIRRLGPSYSRLTPKWYTNLFFSSDLLALVVQGLGGGLAATAQDLKGANKGANIMLFGIVFQLIVILVFSFCAVEFFMRYHNRTPFSGRTDLTYGEFTPNIQMMSYALAFSTACFFIRSIYRIIELAGGWNGKIIHTQVYFVLFDGVMIILAIFTLNFFHPGRLLSQQLKEESREMKYMTV